MLFKDELEFLSNFYPSPIHYKGTIWTTAEHVFQAAKCIKPEDEESIRKASTPKYAKGIGRRVQLRSDWEEVKVDVMTDIVLLKFTQNKDLKTKLLETGDTYLEEGNYWHDNTWGNCYCDKCKGIEGQNILGLILMEVRESLKDPEKYVPSCLREQETILESREKTLYGIGDEDEEFGVGFWLGPFPFLEDMLETPGRSEKSIIVRFNKDGTDDLMYRWHDSDDGSQAWIKEKRND